MKNTMKISMFVAALAAMILCQASASAADKTPAILKSVKAKQSLNAGQMKKVKGEWYNNAYLYSGFGYGTGYYGNGYLYGKGYANAFYGNGFYGKGYGNAYLYGNGYANAFYGNGFYGNGYYGNRYGNAYLYNGFCWK